MLLNGSNDDYNKEGCHSDPGTMRYMQSPDNDIIVEGKSLACEILVSLSQLETDAKCTVIMGKLKAEVRAAEKERNKREIQQKSESIYIQWLGILSPLEILL